MYVIIYRLGIDRKFVMFMCQKRPLTPFEKETFCETTANQILSFVRVNVSHS